MVQDFVGLSLMSSVKRRRLFALYCQGYSVKEWGSRTYESNIVGESEMHAFQLSNVGLARRFWAEAVNTICYLINDGLHTGIDRKTPYEVWFGKLADYSSLKVLC